jgi:hypothetical protein
LLLGRRYTPWDSEHRNPVVRNGEDDAIVESVSEAVTVPWRAIIMNGTK